MPKAKNPFDEDSDEDEIRAPSSVGSVPQQPSKSSKGKEKPSSSFVPLDNGAGPSKSTSTSISKTKKTSTIFDDDIPVNGWDRKPRGDKVEPKFYHLAYYGSWFDITVADFLARCLKSLIPYQPLLGWGTNPDEADDNAEQEEQDGTLSSSANPYPDLYGPIWITTTLVLLLSVISNVSYFLHSLFQQSDAVDLYGKYSGVDFERFWIGGVILYSYVFIIPILLMVIQPCIDVEIKGSLVHTICIYGYSLVPVIIATMVCMVPITLVQLISMGSAFFVSTWFVMFNIWRSQAVENRSLAYFVKLCSGVLHVGLGFALTFVFFVHF